MTWHKNNATCEMTVKCLFLFVTDWMKSFYLSIIYLVNKLYAINWEINWEINVSMENHGSVSRLENTTYGAEVHFTLLFANFIFVFCVAFSWFLLNLCPVKIFLNPVDINHSQSLVTGYQSSSTRKLISSSPCNTLKLAAFLFTFLYSSLLGLFFLSFIFHWFSSTLALTC